MLHERTAPLVDHDAVAVRDQSDTLVLYADRLTATQRAALRRYLLDELADKKGPAATVTVAAGATELVLAGTKGRRQGATPLGLVGTVTFTLVAGFVAAAFVTAVVFLLVDAQLDRGGRPLMAADGGRNTSYGEPQATPQPSVEGGLEAPAGEAAPLRLEQHPSSEEPAPPDLTVVLPGPSADMVQDVVPPAGSTRGLVAPPAAVPAPALTGAPSEPSLQAPAPPSTSAAPEGQAPPPTSPVDGSDQPDVALPDPPRPDVDLPEVDAPSVDLPDIDLPDVELPDVEVPDVDLPDVDLPEVDLPVPDVEVDVPDVEIPDVEIPDVDLSGEESSEDDSVDESVNEESEDAGDPDE